MAEVLKDRILEVGPLHEHDLRPSGLFRVGEDPAVVVLRLYDEDAKSRDKNVIYLRGAIPEWQGDVIQQVIVGWLKVGQDGISDKLFAVILIPGHAVPGKRESDAKCEAGSERNGNVDRGRHGLTVRPNVSSHRRANAGD